MIGRAATLLALIGVGRVARRHMTECAACGSHGLWMNYSTSLEPYGVIETRTPWSRTYGVTLFHRELVIGYLKPVTVGLVVSEES